MGARPCHGLVLCSVQCTWRSTHRPVSCGPSASAERCASGRLAVQLRCLRAVLLPQSSVWSYAGCEFDVCPRCIAAIPPAASSVPSSAMQSSPAAALAEDEKEFDGCGLATPPPAPGSRRSGGVLTLVLACGTVCHVSACAGFESAIQIYGMLGDVRSGRELDYVVYDNACMLRRFVANKRWRACLPRRAVTWPPSLP